MTRKILFAIQKNIIWKWPVWYPILKTIEILRRRAAQSRDSQREWFYLWVLSYDYSLAEFIPNIIDEIDELKPWRILRWWKFNLRSQIDLWKNSLALKYTKIWELFFYNLIQTFYFYIRMKISELSRNLKRLLFLFYSTSCLINSSR